MPWSVPDGKEYKLCFLDTNIVSEIAKNKSGELKKFLDKLLANSWMPCITLASFIEIHRNIDVYKKFLEVFSIIPLIVLKTFEQIYEEEKRVYSSTGEVDPVLTSITLASKDPALHLQNLIPAVFSNPMVANTEKQWRENEHDVLNSWLAQKDNFKPVFGAPNSNDAERYVAEAKWKTIIKLDLDMGSDFIKSRIEDKVEIDYDKFPSILVILYSQYYRIHDEFWKPKPQEITDVYMMGPIPYIDVVITENFQAEILRKIKTRIPSLIDLEIYTLRDIRN